MRPGFFDSVAVCPVTISQLLTIRVALTFGPATKFVNRIVDTVAIPKIARSNALDPIIAKARQCYCEDPRGDGWDNEPHAL